MQSTGMKDVSQKNRLLFLLVSLHFLGGCSHTQAPVQQGCCTPPLIQVTELDGAPLNPLCIHNIPDAKPKLEPLSRYGNPATYEVFGKTYHVLKKTQHGDTQKGMASWYGTKFHGRRTSSGEPYDLYSMTAAHKNLPLPTYVSVKNLKNNREIIVKVNDRGPFVGDRIIDLSYAAAKKLGVFEHGTAPVSVTVIDPAHPSYLNLDNDTTDSNPNS